MIFSLDNGNLNNTEDAPVDDALVMSYMKALAQLDLFYDLPVLLDNAGGSLADVHILGDALDVFRRYTKQEAAQAAGQESLL